MEMAVELESRTASALEVKEIGKLQGPSRGAPRGSQKNDSLIPVTLIAKDFCYAIRKSSVLPVGSGGLCCLNTKTSCDTGRIRNSPDSSSRQRRAFDPTAAEHSSSSSCAVKGGTDVNFILRNINVCVKPGSMLVIMGPSGSGKTTLLNALAVWEYLGYFASLKLPGVSRPAREARMREVLLSMNLYHRRDTRIGGSARKSLSGGEMKRVALAVELLNNPSLIFLDEPTTGLDAALAFDTMRLLLRLARTGGRTVVCTVHQPRSQLFAMFDELMLLHSGQIVYQGPATQCSGYFSRLGLRCPPLFNPADFLLDLLTVRNEHDEGPQATAGRAAAEHQLTLPPSAKTQTQRESPDGGETATVGPLVQPPIAREASAAHVLMETEGQEHEGGEHEGPDGPLSHFESHMMRVTITQEEVERLPALYESSSLCADVAARIDKELSQTPGKQTNKRFQQRLFTQKDCMSHWCTQFSVVTSMTTVNFIRNPLVSVVQVALNTFLGIVIGAIFWNAPAKSPVEIAGRNVLGLIFFLATHIVFTPMDCLSLFAEDRELFNRDTANGNYTPLAYFMAKTIASLPFQHVPLSVVLIISYWMAGLSPDAGRFIIYLAIGQLTILATTSFLFLTAAVSPRLSVAQSFSPNILVMLALVCGFFIRDQDIPVWIRWIKYVSFIHYPYLCFAANEFNNNPTWEALPPGFLEDIGGLSDTRLGINIGVLAIIALVLRTLAFFALKYCNRRIGVEA